MNTIQQETPEQKKRREVAEYIRKTRSTAQNDVHNFAMTSSLSMEVAALILILAEIRMLDNAYNPSL